MVSRSSFPARLRGFSVQPIGKWVWAEILLQKSRGSNQGQARRNLFFQPQTNKTTLQPLFPGKPGGMDFCSRSSSPGQPGWLSGLAPPPAQGLILETQDRVPHQAPCMEPASPSACVSASLSFSLCVSHESINKIFKKKKRKKPAVIMN